MAPRRWLLLILAILSLVMFLGGALTLVYSTGLSDAAADAARLPGDDEPRGGQRAVAFPIEDAASLATVENGRAGEDGGSGALLVIADSLGDLPANAHNVSVVRALAWLAPAENGSYAAPRVALANLTRVEGGNVTRFDATVDVLPLAAGRTGWLVKADAEGDIRFVPQERVLGEARAYVDTMQVVWLLALTGVGFLAPIVWLILTHKPTGTRGLPGGVPGVIGGCPECRAPVPEGTDFCPRCGAWTKPRGGA